MELSPRNQISGTIVNITLGEVMADVTLDISGGQTLAAITRNSVERMGLAEGDEVVSIIEATEVMVGKRSGQPRALQSRRSRALDLRRRGEGMLPAGVRDGQRCGRLALVALALTVALSGGYASTHSALAQATPDASAASTPQALETFEITGRVQHPGPVSITDLQQYSPETVEVSYESTQGHESHTFTGVRLFDVLNAAGLSADPAASDISFVHMYVVLSARDGYQVVLSLGELAPELGNAPILLAWEKDGVALSPHERPLQLVVPEDSSYDRYIFAIETIDVRSSVTEPAA
jgi:molybdopterin-binding protein